MKGSFITLATFLVAMVFFTGCGPKEKPEVLATKIQYDVPISSENPQLDWWINNLEGSKRDPFTKRLMDAATSGDIQVYDYFNKPLTPQQVVSMQTDTVYKTLTRPYPPYEVYDTVVYFTTEYTDISKIRFLESWRWDPKTLEIDKKVLGIAPVVSVEYDGQEFNNPLFWYYFDKNYPGKD